jgi:hypothetical protein
MEQGIQKGIVKQSSSFHSVLPISRTNSPESHIKAENSLAGFNQV